MGRGAAHQIADQVRSTEYVPYRYFILPSLIHLHHPRNSTPPTPRHQTKDHLINTQYGFEYGGP